MASGHRLIFHLDLDCFYVSAERLRRSELIARCVAVGGEGPRGVIASCSYEARARGVRSAMPGAQARRACPELIFVRPDMEYYAKLSREVFAQVERFAPVFEAVSIDEGYLDMTGTRALFGEPVQAAQRLRQEIRTATGLPASIGIASNRLVAKIATDFAKPDGIHWVEEGTEAEFLAPLEVRKIPGVGPSTDERLRGRGLRTIADLQKFPREALERELGSHGGYLHDAAWGRGSVAFHEEAQARSISREVTFDENVGDEPAILKELWSQCADVGRSLRAEGLYGRTLKLKLRYPPFETVLRSRVMPSPSQRDEGLYALALELLREHWDRRPIRLLGVGCVVGTGERQFGLFEEPKADVRAEKLDHLKDRLRGRFGDRALGTGRDFE